MAAVDLRHVLLDLLPSSDMTERCRELRIHHHLEKIIPDLWAINAVNRDATMRAGTQPDVEMWTARVDAAIRYMMKPAGTLADLGPASRDAMKRAGTQPDVEMRVAGAGAGADADAAIRDVMKRGGTLADVGAAIRDALIRVWTQPDAEMWVAGVDAVIRDAMIRAGTQPDVEMWMADAGAAIADVQNLLDRILEWPGRAAAPSNPLLRSCLSIRVAFRLSILQELKETGRRLKELVRRWSALDLRKEMMDAMDPCDEEYSYVLGDEAVGRDEDRDNIIEILQQQQSSSNGEPFVIVIGDKVLWSGKTTLARMIYHHPWVRESGWTFPRAYLWIQ